MNIDPLQSKIMNKLQKKYEAEDLLELYGGVHADTTRKRTTEQPEKNEEIIDCEYSAKGDTVGIDSLFLGSLNEKEEKHSEQEDRRTLPLLDSMGLGTMTSDRGDYILEDLALESTVMVNCDKQSVGDLNTEFQICDLEKHESNLSLLEKDCGITHVLTKKQAELKRCSLQFGGSVDDSLLHESINLEKTPSTGHGIGNFLDMNGKEGRYYPMDNQPDTCAGYTDGSSSIVRNYMNGELNIQGMEQPGFKEFSSFICRDVDERYFSLSGEINVDAAKESCCPRQLGAENGIAKTDSFNQEYSQPSNVAFKSDLNNEDVLDVIYLGSERDYEPELMKSNLDEGTSFNYAGNCRDVSGRNFSLPDRMDFNPNCLNTEELCCADRLDVQDEIVERDSPHKQNQPSSLLGTSMLVSGNDGLPEMFSGNCWESGSEPDTSCLAKTRDVPEKDLFLPEERDKDPNHPAAEEFCSSHGFDAKSSLTERGQFNQEHFHLSNEEAEMRFASEKNNLEATFTGNGATRLESMKLDSSNVKDSLQSNNHSDVAYGGAVWDIFRRQDVPKLIEFLRKHQKEFRHIDNLPVDSVCVSKFLTSRSLK